MTGPQIVHTWREMLFLRVPLVLSVGLVMGLCPDREPLVLALGLSVVLVAFVVLAPLASRPVYGARPLPAGRSERVVAACAAAGVPVRSTLLWDTGNVAAARLTGRPRRRRAVVSGRLLEVLDDAELDAVMAHECAHARLRHGARLRYVTAGACLLAVGAVAVLAAVVPHLWGIAGSLVVPAVLAAQLGTAGRRERAADELAARIASPGALRSALEKTAAANGVGRPAKGRWASAGSDHPGLAARLRRLDGG
ncbi:M48 family metallopeptidase [Actinomadura parmotrematis]|uniref:M48 family metalloprotease n=1 Tax=Actinomadura parmotrematis TaxID=2864039 RepID=A0ABS7FQE5_9ACTN|nr:M48 family metalloprotease [Actinomadura parmotrematis]MBW8482190.1 M48 family metalloprotease [Actinomadura parmotrematis]